jgi:hypothetical protein
MQRNAQKKEKVLCWLCRVPNESTPQSKHNRIILNSDYIGNLHLSLHAFLSLFHIAWISHKRTCHIDHATRGS